jgi:RNA polymerase sigma-70 factor (ECF subfamily)
MSRDRHEWFLNQIFRHRKALQRYVRGFVADAEDIDDLIQETYLRIYGVNEFDKVESPKALLFSIAHNLAVERARGRTRRATDSVADIDSLGVVSAGAATDDLLDARRRFEGFCIAVDSLPPVCRRVFVLRKVYQLSHEEIVDVLGIKASTIEKHVVKGLKRCRDYMREHGLLEDVRGAAPAEPSLHRTKDQGEAS